MATVETLVRSVLIEEGLGNMLAKFAGQPAIFYQEAPIDTAPEWGETQYPRIVFTADTFADAERGRRKSLSVDILCAATGPAPEEIEPFVREALAGVFFSPDDLETFSAKWRETQVFKENITGREDMLFGMTVNFDIYEYPLLETSDPDPIMAICRYAQEWDENLSVIGASELPDIYKPTRDNPAVWFSRGSTSIDRQTNTVVWMNTDLIAHFFAPSLKDRIAWVEQFSQSLALDGRIIMLDKSPMFLQRLIGDAAGDEISGQLTIGVQFGILRRPDYSHTMMNAVLK